VRRSGRLGLTVLAGVAAALIVAAPASARVQYATVGKLQVGPVIAGAGAATVEGRSHAIVRWYPARHGPPRVLREWTKLVSDLKADEVTIEGGERLLVVGTDRGAGWPGLLAAGSPLSRPRILARCHEEPVWQPAVDGIRVLYTGPPDIGCRGPVAVQMRDLSDPSAGGPTGIVGVETYSFAYPFAAYANVEQTNSGSPTKSEAVVWDLRSGSAAYRVPFSDAAGGPSLAVGPTGTLVASYVGGGPGPPPLESGCGPSSRALVRTLDDPAPLALSNAPCVLRRLIGSTVVGIGFDGPGQRLVQTDLSGGPTIGLSPRALEDAPGGFSVGHRRFAFALRRCAGGERIVIDDFARAAQDGPGRTGSCPARVRVARHPLDREGAMTVAIGCPRGCTGELQLIGGGKFLEVAGGERASEFRVAPGRTLQRRIRLGKEDVDWLRSLVRLRTRIELLVDQPDGDARRVSRVVMLKLGQHS
jgi:hypothetical protein